jgi:hypothetical protein
MHHIQIKILLILLTVSLLTTPVLAGTPTPTPTPDPSIHFGSTEISYNLPLEYIFQVPVEMGGHEPESGTIELYYYEDEVLEGDAVIDPKHPDQLTFTVNPDAFFLYPFIAVHVQWSVTDERGNTVTSEEEQVIGHDPRYEWEQLDSSGYDLTVYYHDRGLSFGKSILDAAERSAKLMEDHFDAHLTKPIVVVIYNSSDEVLDFIDSFDENTGGQAFSYLGLTIQIIEPGSGMDDWINDVIPHEISHLYFYQATGGEKDSWHYWPPIWLNEGLAQINEIGMDPDSLEYVNWQLKYSTYLPNLKYLDEHFGDTEEVTATQYQMAYSVTSYVINTYGEGSMADILAAYANNARTEEAFVNVLGINFATLSKEWREASGLPLEEKYYAGPKDTATPTNESTRSPTGTPVATPTPRDTGEIVTGAVLGLATLGVCCFLLVIVIIILLVILNRRRKKQPMQPEIPTTGNMTPPTG